MIARFFYEISQLAFFANLRKSYCNNIFYTDSRAIQIIRDTLWRGGTFLIIKLIKRNFLLNEVKKGHVLFESPLKYKAFKTSRVSNFVTL